MVSCFYDVEEMVYPGGCNIGTVTYTQTIIPILETSCLNCHDELCQSGGLRLDSYAGVKQSVDTGRFLGSIRHDAGFSPMPSGEPQLPDCSIMRIQAWIDAGALNN